MSDQHLAVTDLTEFLREARGGDGVQWSLEAPSDLNVNLVHLDAGHAIAEHENQEVDVVIVVMAGSGVVTVDDAAIEPDASIEANEITDVAATPVVPALVSSLRAR